MRREYGNQGDQAILSQQVYSAKAFEERDATLKEVEGVRKPGGEAFGTEGIHCWAYDSNEEGPIWLLTGIFIFQP